MEQRKLPYQVLKRGEQEIRQFVVAVASSVHWTTEETNRGNENDSSELPQPNNR